MTFVSSGEKNRPYFFKYFLGLVTCNCTAYLIFWRRYTIFLQNQPEKQKLANGGRNISPNDHKKYHKAFQESVKYFRHAPE